MSKPPANPPQTLRLQLSLPDINLILEALGQMAYARVHELIHNIQTQAQNELNPPDASDRE
jgi:hypothetical protein